MEETKVISIRITKTMDEKIEKFLRNRYTKRNAFVNQLFEVFFDTADWRTQNDILTYYRLNPKKKKLKFVEE